VGNNFATGQLLSHFLEDYGMQVFGSFQVAELNFRGARLLEDFPVENESMFHQLYGYEDIDVPIALRGFDECSYAFLYNTTSKKCELQRHTFGTVTNRMKFETFKEMMELISSAGYDKIFKI